jgi:hypothetical protein
MVDNSMFKICSKCGRKLPLESFYRTKRGEKPRTLSWCRSCFSAYHKEHSPYDPIKYREYYLKNKAKLLRKRHERRQEIRLGALKNLHDPPKCFNCGVEDYRVLDVEHIYDDPENDRDKMTHEAFLKTVMLMNQEDALKRLQILCRNCNWIKFIEKNERRRKRCE